MLSARHLARPRHPVDRDGQELSSRRALVLSFSAGAVVMAYGLGVVLALPPRWMPLGAAVLLVVTFVAGLFLHHALTRHD